MRAAQFRLYVDTDNAAFAEAPSAELVAILRRLAVRLGSISILYGYAEGRRSDTPGGQGKGGASRPRVLPVVHLPGKRLLRTSRKLLRDQEIPKNHPFWR
jgi:hypothetical protein